MNTPVRCKPDRLKREESANLELMDSGRDKGPWCAE
jgi:hypothetical protein